VKCDITLAEYEGYRNVSTKSFNLNIKDTKTLLGHYVVKYGQVFVLEDSPQIKWYQFLYKGKQIDLTIEFPEVEVKETFSSPKLNKLLETKACR
jgi:hypothetical protein